MLLRTKKLYFYWKVRDLENCLDLELMLKRLKIDFIRSPEITYIKYATSEHQIMLTVNGFIVIESRYKTRIKCHDGLSMGMMKNEYTVLTVYGCWIYR